MLLDSYTVLPVNDIPAAVAWYRTSLAFEAIYLHEGDEPGEPTNYAILERDGVRVHLILDEGLPEYPWAKAGMGYLYLRVADAAQLAAEVKSRGVTLSRELQTEPWGNPAFNLTDPSGNHIHLESWT
ncbi:MAG: VOC family protein [Planctomycetaceae bacterium]|nr:VOC family protein [Planctomycetaceae bacterium]